ncbi:MAG: hypothetical protein IKP98_02690 [Bacilli bacterium]|nr:hypothetical protein [Bacilli bacterium]
MKKLCYVLIAIVVVCLIGVIVYFVINNKTKNNYDSLYKEIESLDCSNLREDEFISYSLKIVDGTNKILHSKKYVKGDIDTKYKIAKEALEILESKKCVSDIYYDENNQAFTYYMGFIMSIWELEDYNSDTVYD